MAYSDNCLDWSTDRWERLNEEVGKTGARIRVVRPLLRTFGDGSGYVDNVPALVIATAVRPLRYGATPAVPAALPLLPVQVSCEFFLEPEQVEDEDYAITLANRAASLVAQAEDLILLRGASAPLPSGVIERNLAAQVGLQPVGLAAIVVPPVIAVPPAIPVPPAILTSVGKGIVALRLFFQAGPYTAIVAPDVYQLAYTPSGVILALPIEQLRPLLRGGAFVDSPAIPAGAGFLLSLGGDPIDLTVPVDAHVEVIHCQRGALLRVVEQFRLRIKDANAIVALP